MEIILNELSLHKQFCSIEDFVDSLMCTMRLYKLIPKAEFTISKKSDLWSYKPTEQHTLNEILKIGGNDKIRMFKSMLFSFITNEPFWDFDQKHKNNDEYICKYTTDKSGYSIAEACERDKIVISFESSNFKDKIIEICKNGLTHYSVNNIYDKNYFLDYFINLNTDYFVYFCKNRFDNHKVDFVYQNGNYHIQDLLNSIGHADKLNIIKIIKIAILDHLDKSITLAEPYSKNLKDGIFELRISLSNRICRLLYFNGADNTIVITHGFIKKQQKTPPEEIKKAILIRNFYLR